MKQRRLWMLSMAGAVVLLAGCNTESASTDEASGALVGADTVTAVNTDTTDTATTAGAPAVVADTDSIIQPVEELVLHAIGNTLEEMHFDQDTLEANASALVKLKLTNEAQEMPMVHNIVITAPGKYKLVALAGEKAGASGNYIPQSQTVLAATPIALPGQTVELEFTAPAAPGVYDFVCTYPGHWQRMNGKFIVK